MPVYSMTGYASVLRGLPDSSQTALARSQIQLEIRSVNGRFLDLSLRLPDELRQLEPALRERVGQKVRRGKIELKLSLQASGDSEASTVTDSALQQLAAWQEQVQRVLPQSPPLSVQEALGWCRSLRSETTWPDDVVLATADQCIQELLEARAREGQRLVQSLLERIAQLRQLAIRAEPLIPAVVQRQQQRFLERWSEALAQAGGTVSSSAAQERALTEAAAHAIRIDVAEELTRLRSHLDEIQAQLTKGGELGKRLDFLIQELQREANTLGAKSAALELTGIGVDMKVLIEQMREQVQNIE
jgi:uncharacterized protein (TIGR00255 family)